MTRRAFIESIRRQIYGGQPSDDATITINLVNLWLNQAIAVAAKTNYKEAIALDGIGYTNNSFYSTFSGIAITQSGTNLWKMTLPEVPVGVGRNEGISTVQVYDSSGNLSQPLIPISENQRTYYQNMRNIPNKVIYYYEGNLLYIPSTILLSAYSGKITMISGGDSTDLNSNLNVPQDYFPVMVEYLKQQLVFERMQPVDLQNDGVDFVKST